MRPRRPTKRSWRKQGPSEDEVREEEEEEEEEDNSFLLAKWREFVYVYLYM